MKNYIIYTDGGCNVHAENKLGACAFVVLEDGKKLIHSKAFKKFDTTNNAMEMSAIIAALMWMKKHCKECRVYINTDSQYVQLGMTEWLDNWIKRGWKTAGKKPVKNKELWVKLKALTDELNVQFQWVKGHAGNQWNEHVDKMCTAKMKEYEA